MFHATLFFGLLVCSELYLFSLLSSAVTVFERVYFSLVTGLLGAFWARKEGGAVLKNLITEMQSGQAPQNSIIEGTLVLLGGLLLIAPGFISDFLGLLLIFPLSRTLISKRVQPALAAQRDHSAQRSGVYDQEGYTYQSATSSVHVGKIKLGSGAQNETSNASQNTPLNTDKPIAEETINDTSATEGATNKQPEEKEDDFIDLELDDVHTEETSKVKTPHQWNHPEF